MASYGQQTRLFFTITLPSNSFVSECVPETSSPLRNHHHHPWSTFGVVWRARTNSFTDCFGKGKLPREDYLNRIIEITILVS